ncbi:LppX_LprAFG lipoprotein [Isoptericola sp. NPDC019482]|uniref:LppX_LprAFG lipoprotein n=1 Tax=Isoptericola sp. NPDC019482 TaxID=3154688 RepID=UPI00348FBF59
MRVPQKTVALASAGLVALSLAACGSEGPAAPAVGEQAADEPAAKISTVSTMTDLAGQMQAAQEEASSAHMELTYSGELAESAGMTESTTTADVAYGPTFDETTMQMSMAVMGMDMDIVLLDGTIYLSMGEMTQGKYLSMTADDMAEDPALAGTIDSMESMDTASQAEAMADAVTSFEHTGTETVDGVETQVYTATIDPSKVKDGTAGIDASTADQLGEISTVYKVDPRGLPLEADITMEVEGQEMVVESTFSKWGEPVDVTAPSADDVIPYSEFGQG